MVEKTKNILLICDSDASNGLMATATRRATKKRQIEVTIKATGEPQLDGHTNEIDCLLIGPHSTYTLNDIQEQMTGRKVKTMVIPQVIYGTLDGEKALDLIMTMEG